MNIGYYPGCSGLGTSLDYNRSTCAVCAALGLTLQEVPDWSCCGSTPAHAVDHTLSTALSARNLVQAKAGGLDRVATPCPSCLGNLKTARHRLRTPEMMRDVRTLLEEALPAQADDLPDTFSVLQILLEDIGLAAIKKRVTRPLKGLKVVPYYGCMMSRPADIMQFDDPENPTSMDKVLGALGLDVVGDYPLKTECCGAAMGIPRRDITATLTGRLLERAKAYGADAIAVACPLCQMNLDLRQPQAESAMKTQFDIPVLYFTQFMGLAFGLPEEDLMLNKLCVSPAGLQGKLRTAQQEGAAPKAAEAKASKPATSKAEPKEADAADEETTEAMSEGGKS